MGGILLSRADKSIIPLLDALKWQGDNSKIKEAMVVDQDNFDTEAILETMANLNFKNFKLGKIAAKDLPEDVFPVLIEVNSSYYVLVNVDQKKAIAFDCQKEAYCQIDVKDLKGVAYFFQYAQDLEQSLVQPQANWMSKLLYRFRMVFAQVAFITLLLTLLNLLVPVFIVIIFDQIFNSNDLASLFNVALGIIVYLISSYSLSAIRSSLLNNASARMGYIVLSQTYSRLMYLSPSYTETASPTSQMSRIRDFDNIKNFINSEGFIGTFNLLFSPIYIIALIVIGGWIGFVPLVTLAILIIIGLFLRPFHKLKMESLTEASAQRQQSLLEILYNTDKIKSSGIKHIWINRMKKHIGLHLKRSYDLTGYVSKTNNISYFITNVAVLIMIYGGVIKVFEGEMSTGLLIGTLILAWKSMNPIRGAFSMAVQINGLLKSIKQINKFMNLPQDNYLKNTMVANKEIKGRISFRDVSIKYNPASSPALLGVNFDANPMEVFGLTGHDGAGKSTIFKLIMGMYQPQAGRVIIDEMNIKQIEPLTLRRAVSYANERDIILTSTLRECFTSYQPDIEDDEILYLCEQTGFLEHMTFLGYTLDTYIDTKELQRMSGTSKKLLNLTRMLARKATIYLVDEMEDYLDKEAIEKVFDLILRIAKNNIATVMISTQDDWILERCDKILRLDKGKVKAYENLKRSDNK